MTTAIILAAGKSTRMGTGVDKAFFSLINKPVVAWSLVAFDKCPEIDRIVLVVRKDQLVASKAVVKMFGISKLHAIVAGGTRRQDSVEAGIKACDVDTRYVVVHDAARPCITGELISELVKLVKRGNSVVVGKPMTDTVKRCDKGAQVSETVSREKLWTVQTPQGFNFRTLRDAYKALDGKMEITDDAQAVEMAGGQVKVLEYLKPNFKITTSDDLQLVSALLK